MFNHFRFYKKKLEFYVRVFRNLFNFLKLLITTKPNNLKVLNKLHLMWLEHEKLKINVRNLLLQKEKGANRSDLIYPFDELSIYSQHGEDGITLKILSKLEISRGSYVELGAGGYTSNTQILSLSGWSGTCFDGDGANLKLAKEFFRARGINETRTTFVESWITAENINELIEQYSDNKIDLLSIDLDGIDYWILEELRIAPKLIILEYNASFGDEMSVSVPYVRNFDRWDGVHSERGWYYGASLSAYDKLMQRKGYKLVYCETSGVNAFYVRSDLLKEGILLGKDLNNAFYGDKVRLANYTQHEQVQHLLSYSLVKI